MNDGRKGGEFPHVHGNSYANGPGTAFKWNWEYKYLILPWSVTIYDFP